MERFKIGEWTRAANEFEAHCPALVAHFEKLFNPLLSCYMGYIAMDISHLEQRIEKRWPGELRNDSMANVIRRHYGDEAEQFVRRFI